LEVLIFESAYEEKNFKAERIQYWSEKGAQCLDSVYNLLVSKGGLAWIQKSGEIERKPVF
jgi:ribosomal protein S16